MHCLHVRYTPEHKRAIVERCLASQEAQARQMVQHAISEEELSHWEHAYSRFGVWGLRKSNDQAVRNRGLVTS